MFDVLCLCSRQTFNLLQLGYSSTYYFEKMKLLPGMQVHVCTCVFGLRRQECLPMQEREAGSISVDDALTGAKFEGDHAAQCAGRFCLLLCSSTQQQHTYYFTDTIGSALAQNETLRRLDYLFRTELYPGHPPCLIYATKSCTKRVIFLNYLNPRSLRSLGSKILKQTQNGP